MNNFVKFDPSLFFPFSLFKFSNETPENSFSVIVKDFIRNEKNLITPIEAKEYIFGKSNIRG